VPASSPAAQYFCTPNRSSTADSSNSCFAHDTTAWCDVTPLSNTCPMLQPFADGDCKNKDNVLNQFEVADVSSIGVHYGPSSICIGVPGGTLTRNGADTKGRTWKANIACVASECHSDGVYLLIKDVSTANYTPHLCPDDGYLELGVDAGFPDGVRSQICLPIFLSSPFTPATSSQCATGAWRPRRMACPRQSRYRLCLGQACNGLASKRHRLRRSAALAVPCPLRHVQCFTFVGPIVCIWQSECETVRCPPRISSSRPTP
jgi:hypothetical protein